MSKPRDHAFVRSANPNFGSTFGGGCAEQIHTESDGWITCGFPESAHPDALPEISPSSHWTRQDRPEMLSDRLGYDSSVGDEDWARIKGFRDQPPAADAWWAEPDHAAFVEDLLKNAPGSWDGDEGAESIAVEYVRELERRLVAFGGSLERWLDDESSGVTRPTPPATPEGTDS